LNTETINNLRESHDSNRRNIVLEVRQLPDNGGEQENTVGADEASAARKPSGTYPVLFMYIQYELTNLTNKILKNFTCSFNPTQSIDKISSQIPSNERALKNTVTLADR
jgi:hypothetical protein